MEPEKAKAFIEKLFMKIDKNQSGKIEKTETINWIRELEENYIKRDSIEEFKAFDSNGDRFITFEGRNFYHFMHCQIIVKLFRNSKTRPDTE